MREVRDRTERRLIELSSEASLTLLVYTAEWKVRAKKVVKKKN